MAFWWQRILSLYSREGVAHYAALLLLLVQCIPLIAAGNVPHLPHSAALIGKKVPVCTAFGISYISLEDAVDGELPAQPDQQHCSVCSLAQSTPVLLATANNMVPLPAIWEDYIWPKLQTKDAIAQPERTSLHSRAPPTSSVFFA